MSSQRTNCRPPIAVSGVVYIGCIAGTLSKGEYEAGLETAGFEEITVEFTHRVADGTNGCDRQGREDPRP